MKKSKENNVCTVYSFLSAAKGNWRNSIFIECNDCLYDKDMLYCLGFLLNSDAVGRPIVIPVDAIQKMTGMDVEKDECLTVISRPNFEKAYAKWLEWQIDSSKKCALLQLVNRNHCANSDGTGPCCR